MSLHEHHRNAGKVSDSAKTTVRQYCIEFVNINSQSNEQPADSSGPIAYFLPKFSTIQVPKSAVCYYLEERMARTVVG